MQRMNYLRQRVCDLLTPELAEHGGDRQSESEGQGDIITLTGRGTSKDYTVSRLKRDNPELAQKVIKGEVSANAAAIQQGFRKKSATVRLEPEPLARMLIKQLTAQ